MSVNFQPAGAKAVVSELLGSAQFSIDSSRASHVLTFTAAIVPEDWSHLFMLFAAVIRDDTCAVPKELPGTTGTFATDSFATRLLESPGARLRVVDEDIALPMDSVDVAKFTGRHWTEVGERGRFMRIPPSLLSARTSPLSPEEQAPKIRIPPNQEKSLVGQKTRRKLSGPRRPRSHGLTHLDLQFLRSLLPEGSARQKQEYREYREIFNDLTSQLGEPSSMAPGLSQTSTVVRHKRKRDEERAKDR